MIAFTLQAPSGQVESDKELLDTLIEAYASSSHPLVRAFCKMNLVECLKTLPLNWNQTKSTSDQTSPLCNSSTPKP